MGSVALKGGPMEWMGAGQAYHYYQPLVGFHDPRHLMIISDFESDFQWVNQSNQTIFLDNL